MDKQELKVILEESSKYYYSGGKEGYRANLSVANLSEANLSEANLDGANLTGANLYKANLYKANLHKADLWKANLHKANLTGANLRGANLAGANLNGANLSGVSINNAIGNRKEICSAQIGEYSIVYTSTQLAVGCIQHSIEEWKNPTFLCADRLRLWKKHSEFIWNMLDRYPADKQEKSRPQS